jgi:RNA polymerase sigma-70 factor (ECF subfamily)
MRATTLSARREAQGDVGETDAALFEAIGRGDLGPLGALFDRHHEAVRQFLLRTAPNDADVDDLVQETFITASRAAASFDGRASALPFLIGVAVRLVRRKKRTFARLRALYEAFAFVPLHPGVTPEESTSAAQQEERLRQAIARLPEDRRIALVMVEYNGLTGVEAAGILGVPVGTVWRRLHEARNDLRRALGGGSL